MDHLGPEVLAKIRRAIKAKLVELSVYVDDELPDYIMVMVANRKSPAQMEEDLGLFLNEHNQAFVAWLNQVLAQLQKVAAGPEPPLKKKKRRSSPVPPEATTDRPTPASRSSRRAGHDSTTQEPRTVEAERPKRAAARRSPRPRSRSPASIRPPPHYRRTPSPSRHFRKRRSPPQTRGSGERSGPRRSPDRVGKHFRARTPTSVSPPRPGLTSTVGAIISHESDGEYDAERMLKKSLVASQVKVVPPAHTARIQANRNLVLKAVADADRSLERPPPEAKRGEAEMDAVHRQRQLPSQTRRASQLDERVRPRTKTTDQRPDPALARPHRRTAPKPRSSPGSGPGMGADEEERQRKTIPPPTETAPANLRDSDLRFRLGRSGRDVRMVEHPPARDQINALARQSGLTIKVKNDCLPDLEDEDPKLAAMRQKAIESMQVRQRSRSRHASRSVSPTDSGGQEIEEKKIIIPLNDNSSDSDESDGYEINAEPHTMNGSDSSLSSLTKSSWEGEAFTRSKVKASKDPRFIVTLKGIDQQYFRKTQKLPIHPSPPRKVAIPVKGQVSKTPTPRQPSAVQGKDLQALTKPVVVKKPVAKPVVVKKPEAKVAPSVRTESKPLRKRITAPEPDPTPASKVSPAPVSNEDKPVCKFWPRCTRGEACFFFHPHKTSFSQPLSSKYVSKPTLARIPSKEKLTWTSASARP